MKSDQMRWGRRFLEDEMMVVHQVISLGDNASGGKSVHTYIKKPQGRTKEDRPQIVQSFPVDGLCTNASSLCLDSRMRKMTLMLCRRPNTVNDAFKKTETEVLCVALLRITSSHLTSLFFVPMTKRLQMSLSLCPFVGKYLVAGPTQFLPSYILC